MQRNPHNNRGPIAIIACDAGKPFAERLVKNLDELLKSGQEQPAAPVETFGLVKSREESFPNTEIMPTIDESIRGCDLYIVQDCENKVQKKSVDQQLRALKTMIDAAWRADAHYITAVIPYFPYSRQDRAQGREPITASMVSREIEDAGARHVMTLDVHNEAIAGFFRRATFENLRASIALMPYIKDTIGEDDLVVVSPDAGGTRRAEYYAKHLHTPLGIIHKSRDYSCGAIESMVLLEPPSGVNNKKVLLIDDMIATAGTLQKAVELLRNHGAKDISFACSLPLFTKPAIKRIEEAVVAGQLNRVISTDAVFHGGDAFKTAHPWYHEVSVAPLFAEAIYRMNKNRSISELLSFSHYKKPA
ncbi:ribose-phosphate pyrophosphokinase [Candidatus Woesearchaeota archaeon]|nr:ribose-phosphate pyrophosphokinase [Candidatus Woesearchaeota archaeon]